MNGRRESSHVSGRATPVGVRLYRLLRSIPTTALWLLVVVWTVPTLGLLVNSFRTRDAQREAGWWLIWRDGVSGLGQPTMDNYQEVLGAGQSGGLGTALANSATIAVVSTILPLMIGASAAYAFAWIEFRGREWLFIATVALMAVPPQMSLIPLLQMFAGGAHLTLPVIEKTITVFPDLDLAGTIPAVWLAHTGLGLPFTIFLFHNYMAALPREIFESAKIDGADHLRIFWRMVLPLSVPVLAAFAIFQFLWTWNDYLIALAMIGGARDQLPATVIVASLTGEFGQREHLLTAGAFVLTIVPLTVFLLLQRFFV